jgi:mRNA interferase MazF
VARNSGKSNAYIPERGDIVWIEFDPSQGSEIKKTRPALVVSPLSYNQKVGLFLICPITSQVKGYPFEVLLSSQQNIKGVVLADHVKSLDWKVRKVKFEEKALSAVVNEVTEKLLLLIEVF